MALPLNGKKNRLNRNDLLTCFGQERLQLSATLIDKTLEELHGTRGAWERLIADSLLSENTKERYQDLLNARLVRIYS